jgi:hypothetical protein
VRRSIARLFTISEPVDSVTSAHAPLFGALRVPTHFVAAMGDDDPQRSTSYQRALMTAFHTLRAAQHALAGSLDDAFRAPLRELSRDVWPEEDHQGAWPSMSPTTHAVLSRLRATVLREDAADHTIPALTEFAGRLRVDDLHALAIDAFLVLADGVELRDPELADEHRCVAGILSMSAEDRQSFEEVVATLRHNAAAGRRNAAVGALHLAARQSFMRGNLREAEQIAREAVARLGVTGPSTLAALSYHILGNIVGTQSRDHEAVALVFEAYRLAPDSYRAHGALASLAIGFFSLGRVEAAADCCALLSDAENSGLRGSAYTVAARIAGRRRDAVELDRLRPKVDALLDRGSLIPHTASMLCYMLGAALRAIGDPGGAREYWTRGLDIARRHDVNHYRYLLDTALTTGQAEELTLGPLPLPAPAEATRSAAVPDLAHAEQRLHFDRLTRELETIG